MKSQTPIYYTRCPVPTASGVAFQTGMLAEAFEGSGYEVPNITELGPAGKDVHYTHSIEMFMREGGVAPPVWARANGADSVVLGITFMEEFQGIFVRADDPAETILGLTGRRLALPVWPRLVFNFWRFAALKGLTSALSVHDMPSDAVEFVDVVEGWDPGERRNVGRHDLKAPARCEYRGQLEALLSGEVDAIFGKGPEAGLLQREAEGKIRLLYDVRSAPGMAERINNSTPRLLTTSRHLVEEHFDAVVRYIRTTIRAANWVQANPMEARALIARECSIDASEIEIYLEPNYRDKFLPRLDEQMVEALEIVKAFLHEHRFIDRDFPVDGWIDPRPLEQAYRLEGIAPELGSPSP
jgi:sulfonate transport system substrate-binding protein